MPASRFTQTGNYRVRYQQDQTIFATYAEQASLILGLGLLLLLPLILPKTMLRDVNMILIYAIAVIGLNITTGYTGLINIGQAAFMGVGAYATALAATKLNLPFFLAIPIGGLAKCDNDDLYGITMGGGAIGAGVIYKLTAPAGGADGPWTQTVLHDLPFGSLGGTPPLLVENGGLKLFGTIAPHPDTTFADDFGKVYRLTP